MISSELYICSCTTLMSARRAAVFRIRFKNHDMSASTVRHQVVSWDVYMRTHCTTVFLSWTGPSREVFVKKLGHVISPCDFFNVINCFNELFSQDSYVISCSTIGFSFEHLRTFNNCRQWVVSLEVHRGMCYGWIAIYLLQYFQSH